MVYKSSINTGGGGSGVGSLNALTGALSLTSTGSTVTITPSGSTINLEVAGGGFVPYTGATTNVNLGAFNLSARQLNVGTGVAGIRSSADGLINLTNAANTGFTQLTLGLETTAGGAGWHLNGVILQARLGDNSTYAMTETSNRSIFGISNTQVPLIITDAQSGRDTVKIYNTSTSGYASLSYYNSSNAQVGGVGFGNTSVGNALDINRLFIYANSRDIMLSTNSNVTSQFLINASTQNVAIGGNNLAPSARLHLTSTTEQLRIASDGTNYGTVTTDSAGGVTLLSVGTTPQFIFSNDVKLGVAGNGLYIKGGTNATAGTVTLVAGAATVSTTKVTATSMIMLSGQNTSGTAGNLTVSARAAGTSFTIASGATDTRTIAWWIVELN